MPRRRTRLTALALTTAMLAAVGLAVVTHGGERAEAAGNPQCPTVAPTVPATPTGLPPVTPTPNPNPTPTAPPVYQDSCVLPWLPGWRPRLGAVFNNPLGKKSEAQAIIRRVKAAIKHAPRGSVIRIAVYSFDRSEVAAELRRAKKRGVKVQVVVNGRVMSKVGRKLQAYLGKDPRRSSFLVACRGACRSAGDGGNQHDKVFSFSRTGGARNLVIVSSGNLTSKAVYRQWNDSFAVTNDTGLFDAWVRMFDQMRFQKKVGPRRITWTSANGGFGAVFSRIAAQVSGRASTTVTRQPSGKYTAASDPVVQRMKKVGCAAPAGYGAGGRTVLRISMYAMFKSRGEAIARELARLKRAGCDIRMIMSVPGGKTSRILAGAGIPMRSADWMFTQRDPNVEDGIGGFGPRFYSHYKVMALSGTYAGKPADVVWTGSENWSALSFANEEVVLQVNNRRVYDVYVAQFQRMWNGRPTHRMGVEPTYGP